MQLISILEYLLIPNDIILEAYKPDELSFKDFSKQCPKVYSGLYKHLHAMSIIANIIRTNRPLTEKEISSHQDKCNNCIAFVEWCHDRYWGITIRIDSDNDYYIFNSIRDIIIKYGNLFIDDKSPVKGYVENIKDVLYKYKVGNNDFNNAASALLNFYNQMMIFTNFYMKSDTYYKISNPKRFYNLYK